MSPFYISLEKSKFFFSGHPRVYERGAKLHTDEAKSSPYLLTYRLTEYSICVYRSSELDSLFPLFTGVWSFELQSTLSPERASPYPITFRPISSHLKGRNSHFLALLSVYYGLALSSPYPLTFVPISPHLSPHILSPQGLHFPHILSPFTPYLLT